MFLDALFCTCRSVVRGFYRQFCQDDMTRFARLLCQVPELTARSDLYGEGVANVDLDADKLEEVRMLSDKLPVVM